jgi:hypothetical protein
MRKPGTDPENVQMSDVLCDFCRAEWTEERPFIEGHQGSIVCGQCLTVAYTQTVLGDVSTGPPGYTCTMCLEQRDDPAWQSPAHAEAIICKRCIKLAAGALSKDKESGWTRPVA